MYRRLAAPAAILAAAVLVPATTALADGTVRAEGPTARYDTALVPDGARLRVHAVETGDGRTIVTLHATGLLPRRAYGAHAHTNACGATGALAGPHYQFVKDPVTPSTNPAYANPQNEIWLDLHTNEAGNGHAKAVVDWQMPAERRAQSVILHLEHTHTGPTDSGVAGPRLACVSVPF